MAEPSIVPADLIGELPEAFKARLDATLKEHPECRMALYQNHALDSSAVGVLQGLRTGPGCTCPVDKPPRSLNGMQLATSWAYVFIGWYDPKTRERVVE